MTYKAAYAAFLLPLIMSKRFCFLLKNQHNSQWKEHWSEKTDSSISLTYQQIQKTERTVRQLGEIPSDNKKQPTLIAQKIKETSMKKLTFNLNFVVSWAVVLSVFVGAGGAQYICARSNVSS